MVAWARDEILKLLHPFMPFITEELWEVTARRDTLLALSPWSRKASDDDGRGSRADVRGARRTSRCCRRSARRWSPPDFTDEAAEAEIGWVVDLVTAIRSVRAEMNIAPPR